MTLDQSILSWKDRRVQESHGLRPMEVIKAFDMANSRIVDQYYLGQYRREFLFPVPIHGMDSCLTT